MIAVICAHNPGKRNLGMYSVDLAAQSFFSAHRQGFELVKFTGHSRIGSLQYRIIQSLEELARYDTIVFWGDFQQNPIWGLKNFGLRHARKNRTTAAEGFLGWKQLCLFKDHALKPSQKLFSVGTCFLGARAALENPAAVSEYGSLLARFHAIVPRDPGSVAELQSLGMTNVVPGFDCATLLDREPAPTVNEPCFGYAFGRTFTPGQGERVARRIEELTGHQAIPIRWLLNKYAFKFCDFRYTKALQAIRRVRYVVTDIYHLTINTLNLNRDVICVGTGNENFLDTCDDHKKSILLRMAELEGRYVGVPTEAKDCVTHVATRVAALLDQRPTANFDTFNHHRRNFHSRLEHLLFSEVR
jgi:hypothetical protein